MLRYPFRKFVSLQTGKSETLGETIRIFNELGGKLTDFRAERVTAEVLREYAFLIPMGSTTLPTKRMLYLAADTIEAMAAALSE